MGFTMLPLLRLIAAAGPMLRHTALAFPSLHRLHGKLVVSLHKGNETTVGPFRVRFDRRDRVISKKLILYGAHEKREIDLLCSLVRPGDQVMDVGANIGIYSLYLSRAVGRTGRVIAVEPDPDNLALLKENLEINGCANVTVLPCALGEQSGEARLFQNDDNRGNLSFADLGETGESVCIAVRRSEDALEELGLRPTVAKIDVEGAEPQVISGLADRKPDTMLFEFVPEHLRAQGHDPRAFLDSLVEDGYALYLVDPDSGEQSSGDVSTILAAAETSAADLNILARR